MGIHTALLGRLRTLKSRHSKVEKRQWSLFDLSDDVLLRIYNFLGPVDSVPFALSSRRLYTAVSKPGDKFMVYGDDRLEILQRFEREGVYPMSILCALRPCHPVIALLRLIDVLSK